MKNTNYYVVHGWMINELGLCGNELLIYSIIYGFSQDDESQFTGSLNYLVSFINSTKPTVIKCLKTLCEKGFITKTDRIINNQNFPTYTANMPNLTGGKNSLLGGKETLPDTGKETLPNNNTYNNESIGNEPAPVSYKNKSFKKWDINDFNESIREARDARKENKDLPNFTGDMLRNFHAYWSEPDAGGKMKFQKQDTWATANRLATWQSKDDKFKK